LSGRGDRAPRAFRLRSEAGLEAVVLDRGATLARLRVPDRAGRLGDVVLGFDDPREYLAPHPYVGGIVGRFANRIADARFPLDGRVVQLAANEGPHCLHGGPCGFDRAWWDVETTGEEAVELRLASAAGDGGFPGRLEARVVYRLVGTTLSIALEARADAPTVTSLTSHAYWNLADGGARPILDHQLSIDAGRIAEVGADGIPSGALTPVAGTPFDFRTPRPIGARVAELGTRHGGYDQCFALDHPGDATRTAARLFAPASGVVMVLATTMPALQLYTGACFDGGRAFRGGLRTPRFGALALEPEHFPNAPNLPGFPSARLDPGSVYRHRIAFSFSVA
jgi:aldose 1-epimerase